LCAKIVTSWHNSITHLVRILNVEDYPIYVKQISIFCFLSVYSVGIASVLIMLFVCISATMSRWRQLAMVQCQCCG